MHSTTTPSTLPALKALVRKDLALFFSNKRALVITIAAPILIAAFFGSLFTPKSDKLAKIAIAVVDLDQSALTKKITAALTADEAFLVSTPTMTEATGLVREGKLRAAIVLPSGFGATAPTALFGGADKKNLPQVDIHYDPSQSMALGMVRGILSQHVMQAVSQTVFNANSPALGNFRADLASSDNMPPALKRELNKLFDSVASVQAEAQAQANHSTAATRGLNLSLPFTTEAIAVTSGLDKKYNSYAQSFAGMSVQFILFMGIDLGVGLLLARRLGLWKRLRAAPISRRTLLGSSILSCTLIAMMVMCVIYAAALAIFGVRIEGSVVGFIGIMLAFGVLTSTFGLLIAAIGQTPEATRGLATLATLLMVMLGGAWVPSFIFPEWLQTISLGVPTRWAIDGLAAMTWRGLGLEAALAPIGVMLGFSAVFAAIAVWRFNWEE